MKLSIPESDEAEEFSDEIRVRVWTERTKIWLEPPIVVPKHNLTRWSNESCFEDGQLLLQDGYCDNWDEVNDCLSLLKGLEVEVTFDNIKVFVTFGLHFKISPLLEEIEGWLKSYITVDTFGQTINMMRKLTALGFSEDELTSTLSFKTTVTEFFNNSSRDNITMLLSNNFNELNLLVIKMLLNKDNNHLDIFIGTLADNITSEDECELILGFLQRMISSAEAEVLCIFSPEVSSVIEKIESLTSSNSTLRAAFKLFTELKRKSDEGLGSSRSISLELLLRTRCWRKYSLKQLQRLQKNENIKPWHIAEIFLDWIEIRKPSKETVVLLHKKVVDLLDINADKYHLHRYRFEIDDHFKRLLNGPSRNYNELIVCIFVFLNSSSLVVLALYYSYDSWITLVINDYTVIYFLILLKLALSVPFVLLGVLKFFLTNPCCVFFLRFMMGRMWLEVLDSAYYFCKQLFRPWNVLISVREEDVQKLNNSDRVSTIAFFNEHINIRYLPSFRCDVQLVNHHGMGKFNIEKCYWKKDSDIKHWYIKTRFTNSGRSFYSVCTNSHCEIVNIFNQQCEHLSQRLFFRFYRRFVYYLFGWSSISLCTLYDQF